MGCGLKSTPLAVGMELMVPLLIAIPAVTPVVMAMAMVMVLVI
jgi:hypothetical protein